VFDDQVGSFRDLLRRLRNEAEFVSSDTCIEMVTGETSVDGRFFHLSFDDGFANVVNNAAPVLVELKVPAIFFVPTAWIGSNFEEAERYFTGGSNYDGTLRFASWEELAQAASAGLEIGSHTRNHVRLSAVNHERALEEEISASKREIEARLHIPCHYISWPFGRRDDINREALSLVRTVGYRGCFGAFRGHLAPGETSRFEVPRHHFEIDWPLSHIRYFAEGNKED